MKCFKILFSSILKKKLQFFQVFESWIFFYQFLRNQGSRELSQGLILNCRIVFRVNGMVINILVTPALANFDKTFFRIFGKLFCSKFMDLYDPVKLFKALNRDPG